MITFSALLCTVSEWKSKGLSNEKIKPLYTSNKSLSQELEWMNNSKIRLRFAGSCLKQEDNAAYTLNNVVHLFIVYELDRWPQGLSAKFTLKDCLFGTVKLTKNAYPNKYSYSGYGTGFDTHSIPNFDWGKNTIIFGVDMSSSVYANNKNKDILILGKVKTQGLDNTTLTGEVEYSTNFSRSQRKFCSSLHYNESNSFLFVNVTTIHQFKTKDSEIKRYPLCLGNISKDFSVDDMKKTGLNRYVYDFNIDYNAIAVDNILDIHKYLMKQHDIKYCLSLFKKCLL